MINTSNVVLAIRDVPEHAIHLVNNLRVAVFKDASVFFHIKDVADRLAQHFSSEQAVWNPSRWRSLEDKLRASGAITPTHILPFETKKRGFFLRSDSTLLLVDQYIHDSRSHYTRFCRQTFRDNVFIPTAIELAALARVAKHQLFKVGHSDR